MIRYIKTFEVIFNTNNLSGMHISTMWHSLNVLKYFCPLSVYAYIYIYIYIYVYIYTLIAFNSIVQKFTSLSSKLKRKQWINSQT